MLKSASEGLGRKLRVLSERSFQAEVRVARSTRTKGTRGAIVAGYHDIDVGGGVFGVGFLSLGVLWRRGSLADARS